MLPQILATQANEILNYFVRVTFKMCDNARRKFIFKVHYETSSS
ncbi:hypothetical protein VCHA43P277_20308 [Vibrio chagasii]|nr:hypothetical protein VCHA35P150_10222 [Vibrio chagasii]CAH6848527.1 hypothetical protein VCHA37O173_10309 [Vibrio chagasii]CAH6852413.1 hypothetical protein VCHA34P126_10308 [Vibrio chagasii]CAH6888129.1 hypothetical protein VCHA29O39_20309 [Vibrio chagasii]CAH6895189.1 hypothetical protein VCHA36P161_20308 [Vibrio chagasii]